jgi:ribonuclease P protein component
VRVARSGRSWASGGLVLQVWRRDDRDGMHESNTGIRVGITASRKVGNAVVRNRVRRRLREAARFVLPAFAAPGRDYVLIGRASTLHRPFAALIDDLKAALRRLGVCRMHATAAAPASAGRRPETRP